jgi:hypothetical protein
VQVPPRPGPSHGNISTLGPPDAFLGFPRAVHEKSSQTGTSSRELRRPPNRQNRRKSLTSTHFQVAAGDRAFGLAALIFIKKHAFSSTIATRHSCAVTRGSIGHLVEGAPAGPFFLWRPPSRGNIRDLARGSHNSRLGRALVLHESARRSTDSRGPEAEILQVPPRPGLIYGNRPPSQQIRVRPVRSRFQSFAKSRVWAASKLRSDGPKWKLAWPELKIGCPRAKFRASAAPARPILRKSHNSRLGRAPDLLGGTFMRLPGGFQALIWMQIRVRPVRSRFQSSASPSDP